jgi:arginyl-tRNA synthetase
MSDFAIPAETQEDIDAIELAQARLAAENRKKEKEKEQKEEDSPFPKLKITDEDCTEFWNCMLQGKTYVQEYDIKGLKFSFRTRKGEEIRFNVNRVDEMRHNLSSTIDFYNNESIIIISLNSFKGKDLSGKSFEDKEKIFKELPSPITGILAGKLAEFDYKVMQMTEKVLEGN